jgi:DnaK suppressor protein
MDQARARALLAGERDRLEQLLQAAAGEPPAAELGDEVDDADRRNAEETGLAVDQLLRARWAALQRAEARLAASSYGRSIRSGQPISDERLEADPLAELTLQEEAAAERGELEEGENAVGLVSAAHPFEVTPTPTSPQRKRRPARRTTTSLPQGRAWASISSPTTRPGSRFLPPRSGRSRQLPDPCLILVCRLEAVFGQPLELGHTAVLGTHCAAPAAAGPAAAGTRSSR